MAEATKLSPEQELAKAKEQLVAKEKALKEANEALARQVKTPQQLAQEASRARVEVAQKKRAAEARVRLETAWEGARKASAEMAKGEEAALFVPFKDRDGQIVPALVLGGEEDVCRDSKNGDIITDPKTQEAILEYKFHVWVFSMMDQPYRSVWRP